LDQRQQQLANLKKESEHIRQQLKIFFQEKEKLSTQLTALQVEEKMLPHSLESGLKEQAQLKEENVY
jgi:hypothetical protein